MIVNNAAENQVCLSQFAAQNDTETFRAAMAYLREHPNTTLTIEPGVYTISDPRAQETFRAVMAGEYGPNPQPVIFTPKYRYAKGFSFEGQKGTRVIGYGVTLRVEGFMEVISVRDCEDVELIGLSIDHVRRPYSRGKLIDVGPLHDDSRDCIVEFDADCPIQEKTPVALRTKAYDPVTDRWLAATADMKSRSFLDSHHMRITFRHAEELPLGTEFYTVHTYHFRPAILIENAKRIRLTDVTIHNQPGMGIVGNRSEDITLTRLSVVPVPGHHFSTNTDATHFTSIKGQLKLENCFFEAQGDDFVNVHAYYHKIVSRESDCVCMMQEKTPDGTHAQTLDYPDVGDCLELTDRETMALIDTYTVVDCTPMPDEWMCRVVLDHALPDDTETLVLADVTRLPNVEIIGCHANCHHARSILIKSRNVLIERNTFRDVIGPAILVAPESWWYEGVAPANITIRGNRIIRCCERWSAEAGAITVLADAPKAAGQCIKNIVIEDNLIDVPNTPHGIYVRNTDGLRIARNRIISKDDPICISDCSNISVEE